MGVERPRYQKNPKPSESTNHWAEGLDQNKAEAHSLDGIEENRQVELGSSRNKKRWVHYSDPDYYEHLPPHLQYLNTFRETGLPFAEGGFGIWTLSYEIEVDDNPAIGPAGSGSI